jgi:hypothetical protein
MKRLHNSLFLILFITTASCFGYSSKPPTKTGAAGAPDNGDTCISCHGSSGNGSLVVSNLPNQYKSGEKYILSVKLSQSGRQRWGFILTALDQNGNQAGTFESNDAKTQVFSASGRQYIGHTSSGTAAGQLNSNTWLMDWIAPAVDTGKISFYASGNAANNNGINTGDNGYKTEVTIEAEVEAGVNIPDPNLRSALEKALGKNEGDAITAAELETLTSLSGDSLGIVYLNGLEYCTRLTSLSLSANKISDLTPLANLTTLAFLDLSHNQISDISPLAKLTALTILWLHYNRISDITPLSRLTNLEHLNLHDNQISDLIPLSKLTNLNMLALGINQLTDEDLSVITSLGSLTRLELHYNQFSDLSSLSKLTNLITLKLGGNKLKDAQLSFISILPRLTWLEL